ncbi:Small subunit (SSU) processome component [Fusarium chlamydosporum]
MSTTKRKAPVKLAAPVSRTSARIPNKSVIDESKASIAGPEVYGSQHETIEISSDADSDEDLSDAESLADQQQEEQQAIEEAPSAKFQKQESNGEANDDEEDAEGTSPSFGELLRAGNDIIDVPSALNGTVASQPTQNAIVAPSHRSLSTVLTQALRTDDTDLLESCLHTTDSTTIRNTVERLDTALAGSLLTKIAARLYRRPGRASDLLYWVQWILTAHGGVLASQPKVLHNLTGLQKVLTERSKGLNSLLALQGKLEMLENQMLLRRKMYRGINNSGDSDSDEDEDEDVIWVEGEDDAARTSGRRRGMEGGFDDSDDDADVPITNGFVGDSDDEEDSVVEEEESDAEESLDEDEVVHEEIDDSMGEDEESD